MRPIVLIPVLVMFAALAPGPVTAQNCQFRVETSVMPEAQRVRILRCLVNELARVRRENAELKRRMSEIEALLVELPAEYANVDGVVSHAEGRAIGRASFLLSARSTGGASALPLDQRVLAEVCGKSGGCAVSVVFRQISLFNAEEKDRVLTGPCQFTYAPATGEWTLGAGCGVAPRSGKDGDQTVSGEDTVEPVLVRSGGACLFAESEPSRSVGREDGFQRDHSPGLFLVAMPARQPEGIRRFECELVLN